MYADASEVLATYFVLGTGVAGIGNLIPTLTVGHGQDMLTITSVAVATKTAFAMPDGMLGTTVPLDGLRFQGVITVAVATLLRTC